MKIIAIGDIHGRNNWKKIISTNEFDKVVFIGDYFDSFDISSQEQIINFKEIIAYKIANFDKVVLLLGNHDYHYMCNINETYSGFQRYNKIDIQILIHEALDKNLIQMCFIYKKYLFSHAGVSNTFCKNILEIENINLNIDVIINDMFKYKPQSFKFNIGVNNSQYGDDVCQTPIWIRPNSLYKDYIDGYIQIVGHTQQNKINIIDNKIILIDTMGTSNEYLSIVDDLLTINK